MLTPFIIKPIIVSTHPEFWTESELAFLRRVMNQMEDAYVSDIAVVNYKLIENKKVPPVTAVDQNDNLNLTHRWFYENITAYIRNGIYKGLKDRNLICWHITDEEREVLGIKDYAGSYWSDNNEYMECWISGDRDSWSPRTRTTHVIDPLDGKRVRITERWRVLLHEAGHAVTHFSGRREELALKYKLEGKDRYITHYFDYKVRDVARVFQEVSFRERSKSVYVISLLKQLVELLTFKSTLDKTLNMPAQSLVKSKIEQWARAIEDFEDYVVPGDTYRDGTVAHNGSLSYRNNNPGNLRWSPYEADNRGGFSYFKTYQDGWIALIHQLTIAATGTSKAYKPDMTLLQFFEKYAPSSDNNHPRLYAEYVADKLGVSTKTIISTLI